MARLEIAVNLAVSNDGNPEMKRELLKSICETDKVVKAVMQIYGIE
jgi:hypothetical protein